MNVRQQRNEPADTGNEAVDAVARAEQHAAGAQSLNDPQGAMLAELKALAESLAEREKAVAERERSLEEHVNHGPGAGVGGSAQAEIAAARREIEERAAKIKRSETLLAERERECENVLTQRRDIIAKERELEKRERKVARAIGQKRSWGMLFYIVGTFAVIGVLSWAVADRIRPATFAASATVVADGRGRALDGSELAEWQRVHDAMVTDPAMLEAAAQRMKQRGILSLATPGALLERLGTDLTASSPQDGTLLLELRGQGQEKTRRELETFTVALTSQSNSGRQRRAGGAAAALEGEVRVGNDPVADERPELAGMIAAGGGVLAAMLVGILWKRLSREREDFERSVIDEEPAFV